MTDSTICKTCGVFDSYVSNGDAGGCQECYDTENMEFSGDYTEQEWEQLIEEYELH